MFEIAIVFILAIVFSLAQVYMIYLYFNSFTQKKVKNSSFFILSFLLMGLIKLLPSDSDALIKTCTFIVVLSIITFASFRGTIAQKIYHTVFFSVIMVLSDLCLSIFVSSFPKLFNVYENALITTIRSFVFNFLSLALSFIIVKLLIYFKVDVDLELNSKEYSLLGIIPVCSLICIFGIERFKNLNMFECYTFLLIANVSIMLLYYKILKKNFVAQKYIIIKRENEYYQSCLSSQKEIIQFKHDFKNILLNIDLCLSEKQIEKAQQQISKLIDVGIGSHERISGCIPVDAILNNKLNVCKVQHINHKIDIQIPHDMNIDSIDISAILGNLLDNAIEATLRLDDSKKRKIVIGIKFVHDKLVIKITNTCKTVKSDFSKNILSSEKEEGRYGIGISSIKDRINRLGGYCDFSYKDEHFSALAVIPMVNM